MLKLLVVWCSGINSLSKTLIMGFPSPARDYVEPPINLIHEIVTDPDCTFFYKVETDVLINASVSPGAIVVVDRSQAPKNGDMVIARSAGNDYLRILITNKQRSWLCAANSKYKAWEITGNAEVEILGVITNTIIPQKNWADVCTR